MDLNSIREKDLRTYSFEQTMLVVDLLRAVEPFKFSKHEAIDNIGSYLGFISIIVDRIQNNEFEELNGTNRAHKTLRTKLLNTLNELLKSFSATFETYQFVLKQTENVQKKIDKALGQMTTNVTQHTEKLTNTIVAEENKIGVVVKDVMEYVNETEHSILSHVLSLMGIFTSITTVIMSLVLTSTSWLSNSDSSSALIVFVIPTLVVLILMMVLLSLIHILNSRKPINNPLIKVKKKNINLSFETMSNSENMSQKDTADQTPNSNQKNDISTDQTPNSNQKNDISTDNTESDTSNDSQIIYVESKFSSAHVIAICISLLSIALCAILLFTTKEINPPHIKYIVPYSEYSIVEKPLSETETQKFFVFKMGRKVYEFRYDESYVHDGRLHYCEEHNTLE